MTKTQLQTLLNLSYCCINQNEKAPLHKNTDVSIIKTFVASFLGLTVRKEILQGRGGHPVPRSTLTSVGEGIATCPGKAGRSVGQAHRTAPHHHLRQSRQSSAAKPDGALRTQKSDSCHSRGMRAETLELN